MKADTHNPWGNSTTPFFAVLGPHRSGTSCVAMVMHALGVHLGDHLTGYEPTGGGEDVELIRICERAMPFPQLSPLLDDKSLENMLATWAGQLQGQAKLKGTVAGGKYPHLCRFVTHLHGGLNESLRIVLVQRDIEASIRSLQARSKKHNGKWFAATAQHCEDLQRSLIAHRDDFVNAHPEIPVLKIDFDRLIEATAETIDQLIGFLGISPSQEQISKAINHVNPALKQHG